MNYRLALNTLTFSRIFFSPVLFILIIFNFHISALVLFFFMGISDYLDGYFARKFGLISEVGSVLDPLADKILVVFALMAITIYLKSTLLAFLSAIIISREIWISALRDLNARKDKKDATRVNLIAKIKTTSQLFSISIYLVAFVANNMLLIVISDISIIIATLLTLYSGYIYTYQSFKKT